MDSQLILQKSHQKSLKMQNVCIQLKKELGLIQDRQKNVNVCSEKQACTKVDLEFNIMQSNVI